MQPPILLVGAPRSGTTWLCDVFDAHPDIAAVKEPEYLWTIGNTGRPDDRLTEEDARDDVRLAIVEALERLSRENGGRRLFLKSCSNTLRIPFLRAVLPDAPIIWIVRDGRAVARSYDALRRRGAKGSFVLRRALRTPVRHWPGYLGRLRYVLNRLRGREDTIVGPRPPGWKVQAATAASPLEFVAWQWATMVRLALEDLAAAAVPHYIIRYEDAVRQPVAALARITSHLGIADSKAVIHAASETADPTRIAVWHDTLTVEELVSIRPLLESTMIQAGYAWDD